MGETSKYSNIKTRRVENGGCRSLEGGKTSHAQLHAKGRFLSMCCGTLIFMISEADPRYISFKFKIDLTFGPLLPFEEVVFR